ncbi:hypothetical protein MKX03_027216 [Papaver bracteatum]|nr:hypothetical protein MKX03_027216 [Papaver bracteatum]
MSSKSSLVSVSCIFFTLLALSFWAHSVDGFITIWHKKTVTVENDLGQNISLKIHCRSSEDDLGEHMLYYKQNFKWRFKVNFRLSTKFLCDSSWYDPNGKKDNIMGFVAYKAIRDWKKHCYDDCWWSIRQDGGYYGNGNPEEEFKFPYKKMFSY